MTPAHATVPTGRQLGLPMMTIFSVKKMGGRSVAHALHFDIVAIASDPQKALHKLRAAVKHHIEFGFAKGLSADEIQQNAPQECWDKLKNAPLTIGESIEIENHRIQTMTQTAIDETESSLTAA